MDQIEIFVHFLHLKTSKSVQQIINVKSNYQYFMEMFENIEQYKQ